MKNTTPKWIRAIAMLLMDFCALLILLGNEDTDLATIYLLTFTVLISLLSLYLEWISFNKQDIEAYNSTRSIKTLLDLASVMQISISLSITNFTIKLVLIGFSAIIILISMVLLKRKQT